MQIQKGGSTHYPCPLSKVMELISKKWTIPMIVIIGDHPKISFSKIMQELQLVNPKMSPRTLSTRLKALVEECVVQRNVIPNRPPSVEYSLTEKGKELREALRPLIEWGFREQETS